MAKLTPIDNKTVLNSSLFTPISSGAIDNIMDEEWSVNDKPIPTNPDKEANIPTGDRYTVSIFNAEQNWNDIKLWTNFFLLDVQHLGTHKTLHVNFKTTKDYSFSIHENGNKEFQYDLHKYGLATQWTDSIVENLAAFFEGYADDKVLEFNFTIHKSNSYTYIVGLEVNDPDEGSPILYKITYLPNKGKNTFVERVIRNETYTIKTQEATGIERIHQVLASWNTEPDGSGITYNPGDTYGPVTNDLTLYAIWKFPVPFHTVVVQYWAGEYVQIREEEEFYIEEGEYFDFTPPHIEGYLFYDMFPWTPFVVRRHTVVKLEYYRENQFRGSTRPNSTNYALTTRSSFDRSIIETDPEYGNIWSFYFIRSANNSNATSRGLWWAQGYNLNEAIEDKIFTISFWCKRTDISSGTTILRLSPSDDQNTGVKIFMNTYIDGIRKEVSISSGDTEDHFIELVGTLNGTSNDISTFSNVYIYPSSNDAPVEIWKTKFEWGDRATRWLPNEEYP